MASEINPSDSSNEKPETESTDESGGPVGKTGLSNRFASITSKYAPVELNLAKFQV